MNPPLLLLGAAILFWGWQTGQWLVAVPVALALEANRQFARRWNLAGEDFNRAADLCTVIALGAGVVLFVSYGNPRAIKLWFEWLPVMLLPLALLQAWSTTRELDLSVLFWSLRRAPMREAMRFNPGYPYAAIWLLGASAANTRGPGFYLGAVALAAWALWSIRPRGSSTVLWFALVAAAGALGYAGHTGLHGLQQWLEGHVPEWLADAGTRTDPYESRTDLGRLGELKASAAIVLRVRPEGEMQRPLLLHRASYEEYIGTTWIARSSAFVSLQASGETTWRLPGAAGGTQAMRRVIVDDQSPRGNPVLSLPAGAARIEGLEAIGVQHNPLGAAQAERPPGAFRYIVSYDPRAAIESVPAEIDLRIPRSEAATLGEVAASLGLRSMPPEKAVQAVAQYFTGRFHYALNQAGRPAGTTPLAHFLLASRAGHCEYFASATVLLLRAAGVPARYATGFSVQERAAGAETYLVRQRHAHAWARAWIGGRWIDIDTTPPDWFAAEAAGDTLWTSIADFWSSALYRWDRARAEIGQQGMIAITTAVAIALALWLAWRLWRGRTPATPQGIARSSAPLQRRGRDSEFYVFESRLRAAGWDRPSGESLSEWLERLARDRLAGFDAETARRALRLHYRYRFDPEGLSSAERGELARLAASLIDGTARVGPARPIGDVS